MDELFKEPKANIYFKNCDCRQIDTPVIMKPSLDPKFWVGECSKCGKIHAEKTKSNFIVKKKIKADRFRGKSSFAKSNGMFESAQEN